MLLWLIPVVIAAAYLFLIHPSLRYWKMRRWRGEWFAHRGLHGPTTGLVENTLPAFEAARDAGYGSELDIQFSRDMQVVVFHDDDLQRLCGDPRKVCQLTLEELRALPLAGADARIPTLREVLDAVDGRVPLLIELKNGGHNRQLCEALMAHLEGYAGKYIVESFNPLIVLWFRLHARHIVRGQLVDSFDGYLPTVNAVGAFGLSSLLLNFLSRPDFVAYNVAPGRFPAPRIQRALFRTPMAAWTVRDRETAAQIGRWKEICIFEDIGSRE